MRFEGPDLHYDLNALFQNPPIFDIRPLQYSDKSEPTLLWNELHDMIFTKKQAFSYLKMIRDRKLLFDTNSDTE